MRPLHRNLTKELVSSDPCDELSFLTYHCATLRVIFNTQVWQKRYKLSAARNPYHCGSIASIVTWCPWWCCHLVMYWRKDMIPHFRIFSYVVSITISKNTCWHFGEWHWRHLLSITLDMHAMHPCIDKQYSLISMALKKHVALKWGSNSSTLWWFLLGVPQAQLVPEDWIN